MDEEIYKPQDRLAEELLTKSEYKGVLNTVSKATRAGCTYSLCKQAVIQRQKTVIIEPYVTVFNAVKQATEEAYGTIAELKSNWEMCPSIQKKYPKEDVPYFFLDDCNKCDNQNKPEKCSMQEVLQGNWNSYSSYPSKISWTHPERRRSCKTTPKPHR